MLIFPWTLGCFVWLVILDQGTMSFLAGILHIVYFVTSPFIVLLYFFGCYIFAEKPKVRASRTLHALSGDVSVKATLFLLTNCMSGFLLLWVSMDGY